MSGKLMNFSGQSAEKRKKGDESAGKGSKKSKTEERRIAFRGPGMPTHHVERSEGDLTGMISKPKQENGVPVIPLYSMEVERRKPKSSNMRRSVLKFMHDVTVGLHSDKGKVALLHMFLDEISKWKDRQLIVGSHALLSGLDGKKIRLRMGQLTDTFNKANAWSSEVKYAVTIIHNFCS
ncbi:hypothetical protein CYMTET_10183 [Cymbomonas tetramitiformis]|uniref:Uncharacterized protein n=1 Tax=Cymbomonas tetramitiformis TaxID=36881 RepID=A0AAE0GPL4_9CHLO|nr:hypothetical protein CYMTET_10183 [Cymbomonas tetramitiformis]